MADKLPPTPELDKAAKHQEEINTLMSFLEHLTFEKDIVLATWVPCSVELHGGAVEYTKCLALHHLVPSVSNHSTLIHEYLGLDEDTMEIELVKGVKHG